jgi:EAL domain-containing protein (putative c-di-GMP-specific phosphodiesterase class I)
MTCQHLSFAVSEDQVSIPLEEHRETWFRPIVDTFEQRILAYECLIQPSRRHTGGDGQTIEAARTRSLAIHAAARQARQGLYFFNLVPAAIDDPELDMRSAIEAASDSRMRPENVVFEVAESDLARDPAHSHRIREYLRQNGFGFALSGAGVGARSYSFQAVSHFEPDFINLDSRLIQNMDQQGCAPTIGKLVQMAELSGARVIAEGVDCVETIENLWLLGVRFMQGPFFGEPSPRIQPIP